ncbi:glycoside hydrolase family 15 protein [Actinokineospora enzanensis]|uniref:glycoside hydrolase family 15 protein n=1 Tax=Actinokineospora enzanensis TaxID=155975 RepID=UPI000377CED8|nr:glycoside hydrolase family 15 protein [Actinokineospora enzanensis]
MTHVDRSIEVILAGQHDSGAYVACPTFPTYRYAWLRDGAWCAYALGLYDKWDSAGRFHRFAARCVLDHAELFGASRVVEPPTRYTLDGRIEDPGDEPWPNFQLDGYGTWLWALAEHARTGHPPTGTELDAARLVARYLRENGAASCYDCWEEYGDRRHTATLGSVIAGLTGAAELLSDEDSAIAAAGLRELLGEHVRDGSFVKHDATDGVDASLLWLSTPLRVVPADEPVMVRTAQRIADELTGPTGGVFRYRGDTYYGGGEWVLSTAWLGWYHAETGDMETARARLRWVEEAFTEADELPEQTVDYPQDTEMVVPWVAKWGPVATPLLWSHAMHLVLAAAIPD